MADEPQYFDSLRDEALRANDQALVIKGFVLAVVAIVVSAAVDPDVTRPVRIALFLALHAVSGVLFVQIGARRRQQANIAAYILVFGDAGTNDWERRLEQRRRTAGLLPVDRWYRWGEGMFLLFIAVIATAGSIATLAHSDASVWAWLLVIAVDLGGLGFSLHQAISRSVVSQLIDVEAAGWRTVQADEAAALAPPED